MSKDTALVVNAIADTVTLSKKLKQQSKEVKCKLYASNLLIASNELMEQAIDMENKMLKNLELKTGVKFEKCEI